jgi:hypothetical protein
MHEDVAATLKAARSLPQRILARKHGSTRKKCRDGTDGDRPVARDFRRRTMRLTRRPYRRRCIAADGIDMIAWTLDSTICGARRD